MTVESVTSDRLVAVWFDKDGRLRRDSFVFATIEIIDEFEEDESVPVPDRGLLN